MMKRTKINRAKQFQDIVKFELIKFFRSRKIKASFVLTVVITLIIYAIPSLLGESSAQQPDVTNYTINFIQFLSTLILISVTLFGGDSLTSDFQDKTGYTLFTNPISRTSLLFGKFTAASITLTFVTGLYYLITSAFSYIRYSALPPNLFLSFIFVGLFAIALLSMSFTISSLFKGSSLSYISFFFIFFLVFPLLDYFLLTMELKPWWSVTFAAGIAIFILEVPYPKDQIIEIPSLFVPGQSQTITNFIPEVSLSLGIFFVYIIVGLMTSMLLFKRKEMT